MKAESNIKPNHRYQLSVGDKKIIITFFENIITETIDGVETYRYDTFETAIPNTIEAIASVENDFEKLLEEAKRNEPTTENLTEPQLDEIVMQNRADIDYLLMIGE